MKITSSNQNPSKKLVAGTKLISDISNHKNTTTIVINNKAPSSSNAINSSASENGTGSDVTLSLNQIANSGAHYLNSKDKAEEMSQNVTMVLGGELIHSLVAMDGNSIPYSIRSINHYKDINGDDKEEYPKREEYLVHISGGSYLWPRKNYVTENDLRKEQKLPIRISYEPVFASELEKSEANKKNDQIKKTK